MTDGLTQDKIRQLKEQLREREREQNCELGIFGGGFYSDRC